MNILNHCESFLPSSTEDQTTKIGEIENRTAISKIRLAAYIATPAKINIAAPIAARPIRILEPSGLCGVLSQL